MADDTDSGASDPFKALKLAISQEIDDFDEAEVAQKYVRERTEIFCSGACGDNGAQLYFGINEIDGYEFVIDDRVELSNLIAESFDNCWRSEADFIVAAEHSLARAKEAFTKRHGIEFSREAIERAADGMPGNLWEPRGFS